MNDLLIRDIDPALKSVLKARASRHGRSQQREAKAILESALRSENDSWVARLRNAAVAVGGVELEEPVRHPARSIDVEEWL